MKKKKPKLILKKVGKLDVYMKVTKNGKRVLEGIGWCV